MIHFTDDSCDLDILDAQALLEFASTDKTRENLGVGVDNGRLCATDGHTLLMFNCPAWDDPDTGSWAKSIQSSVWSHAYVKQQCAAAKATKQAVRLMYSAFSDGKFPPVQQVVPEKGFGPPKSSRKKDGWTLNPVGFNPEYVARIAKVCKALVAKGAQLTGMRGEFDPLRFDVAGEKHAAGRSATVVIMPMRI